MDYKINRKIIIKLTLSIILHVQLTAYSQTSLFGLHCDSLVINTHTIEGYSDKPSYKAGDTIHFMVHSPNGSFNVKFFTIRSNTTFLQEINNIQGTTQNYMVCSFANGCNWDTTFSFIIPKNWKSGYYYASIIDKNTSYPIHFIIKPTTPTSPILVLASSFNWQAYNGWSGASFYEYNIKPNPLSLITSSLVSFQRPMKNTSHPKEEYYLINWLSGRYNFDVISEWDLHHDSTILTQYKLMIMSFHSEYWSEKMYNNLDNFLLHGGNLINMAGNSIYLKVTLKGQQMEVRRKADTHTHDGTKGGHWRILNRPESAVLGSQYTKPGIDTDAPYEVLLPQHWIFEGTSVFKGQLIGATGKKNKGASGHETDKITEFSPSNIEVIARGINIDTVYTDGQAGADMTFYWHSGGGGVFSVGSLNFAQSLVMDNILDKMISNVIQKLIPSIVPVVDSTKMFNLSANNTHGLFLFNNNSKKECMVNIYDTMGNIVWQKNIADERFIIDITHLPSALYLFHVNNNEQNYSQKIIKY